MSVKRALDDSETSRNNRTVIQQSRKRRVNPETESEEGDPIITFASNVNNKYGELDNPPYLVYLYDTRSDHNIGQYHPLMIGKKLSICNIHPVKTYKAANDKIAIIFSTPQEANNFVINTSLVKNLDSNWAAVIPDSAIYKVGVIKDIPLELSIEEIKQGIDPQDRVNIVKIERCMQKKKPSNNNPSAIPSPSQKIEWEESNSIKIVCRTSLPREISIYSYVSKISAYILPVRQCDRCYRYGHVKNNCRSNRKCLKCGGEHLGDDAEFETDSCMNAVKCANCYGPHMANNQTECLYYEYNLEINLIRSKLRCDVSDAEYIAKTRFKKSFPNLSNQEIIARKVPDLNATLVYTLINFKNPYYLSAFAAPNPRIDASNLSILKRTSDLQQCDSTLTSPNFSSSTPITSPQPHGTGAPQANALSLASKLNN